LTAEQSFHEKITPSLTHNVQHITPWSDLPAFQADSDAVQMHFTDDTANMDIYCSDIIESIDMAPTAQSAHLVIAIAVHACDQPVAPTSELLIDAIQIRTAQKQYVFKECLFIVSGLYLENLLYSVTCV
jgi:hypothetical protein